MIDPNLIKIQNQLPFLPGHRFDLDKVSVRFYNTRIVRMNESLMHLITEMEYLYSNLFPLG